MTRGRAPDDDGHAEATLAPAGREGIVVIAVDLRRPRDCEPLLIASDATGGRLTVRGRAR